MKRVVSVALLCATSILALTFASSALAEPGGTFVYGQATAQPVLSIQVGGAGTDPQTPLQYSGGPNNESPEISGQTVTVLNNGTEDTRLKLMLGGLPTGGGETWQLTNGGFGPGMAQWTFSNPDFGFSVVPGDEFSASYIGQNFGVKQGVLSPDESVSLESTFRFPEQYTYAGSHNMSAIISAEDAGQPN